MAQLSGHKNLKSLDSYSVASKKQQKQMSHMISGAKPTPMMDITRPVQNAAVPKASAVLPGMQLTGNNVVNIYFQQIFSTQDQSVTCSYSTPPMKRIKPMILESESDDEA